MNQFITQLLDHETLSRDAARALLRIIAEGGASEASIAAMLAIYRMRPLTLEELAGFRDGLLDLAIKVDLSDHEVVDLCGSGGDNRESFNISTCASFIVAGAGVVVAKHGNYAASSKVGSSNVIETLGIKLSNSVDFLKFSIEKAGICCLHAPLFHPAMKNVAPVRKSLGFRTIFNTLGPLVNPAQPRYQLIGTATHDLARLYCYLLQPTNTRFTIVHSLDGFDEASLTGRMKLITADGERLLSPRELGFDPVVPDALRGGETPQENAAIILDILRGNGTRQKTSVAIANAALAIQVARGLSGFAEALAAAQESLESGRALRALTNLAEVSHEYA